MNEEEQRLECGTSLAEHEWYTTFPVDDDTNNNKKQKNKDESSSPVELQRDEIMSLTARCKQLRSQLANDVMSIAPNKLVSSPFETPEAHYASGQTLIDEKDRYMRVPLVYCDQTASNRPLQSIETYIQNVCLPLYGNTHTNSSLTGSQSTAFVAEARQIVAESVNAKITGKASLDLVLFTGNGTTSSVELLIDCLGVKHLALSASSSNTSNNDSRHTDTRPVVFVGPYEHHSNLLPWRESGSEIVMIPECPTTLDVDYNVLEQKLIQYSQQQNNHSHHDQGQLPNRRLLMGSFSAASNVTGKVCDVDRIAYILHKYGAFAFFDYATAGPYLPIDMNPHPTTTTSSSTTLPATISTSDIAKDAIFISPHKMVGGINTPGILIVKKHLVSQTRTPSKSGGGTVFYVTHTHHRFLSDRIERYEGGTPNIVGIFRAGLSFLVKRQISDKYRQLHTKSHNSTNHSSGLVVENGITTTDTIPKTIHEYEFQTHRYVVETLKQTAPNLIMLGCSSSDPTNDNNNCLPIFSFLIKCGHRFLHYNFVCALLNDLFGIQSRGGCQCAGPYSQHLLGLTERSTNNTKEGGGGGEEVPNDNNKKFEYALLHYKERSELLRPGFTRLSLPYKGLHDEEVEYVLKALQFVAKNGWVFVSQYRCNHRTGEWRHFSRQGRPLGSERKWLSHYHFSNNLSSNDHRDSTVPEYPPSSLKDILDNALKNAEKQLDIARTDMRYISQALKMEDEEGIFGTEKHLNDLRWYVYPKECASWLKEEKDHVPATDSTELIGGIRPFGYFETPTLNKSSSTKIHHEEEKKQSSEIIDMEIENGNGEDNNNHEVVYYFRDGEYHSGEASLHEILTGYDDGELSNKCLVFFPKQNEWSTIQDIKSQFSGSKASPQSSSQVKSLTTTITSNGESKKPSRDSCSWGRQPEHQISIPDQPSTIHSSETTNDNITSNRKRKNMGKITPPPKLMRYITQAMMQWDMIQDGDRLLLGLSGGKDSLSLLHCLLEYKRKLPIKFEIEVCTIDPMTPSFDPSPLIPYVESLGLKYHYIRDNIVERANSSGKNGRVVTSLCAFCARMKRGNLYNCARKNKCNKLVLAQHLDDCAESFMMSVMHNGFLRTMKANYRINAGDISVIRPLVYCRENLMTEFAKSAKLPVINENCPACFEEPKERARVKSLLKREETLYPQFYDNIRRSLIPLMHDESTAILRCYTEEAVSKSRKKYDMKIMQKKSKMDLEDKDEINTVDIIQEPDVSKSLSEFTEEELVRELARRKANTYRLSGAMKRLPGDEEEGDPLGQSCSLDGGGDCIPCRELMP